MVLKNKKKSVIVCSSEYITSDKYGGLAIFLKKFLNILKNYYNVNLVLTANTNKTYKHNNILIHEIKINNIYFKILKKYAKWIFCLFQSYLVNNKIDLLVKENSDIKFVHFSNYQCLGFFYRKRLPSITRLSSLETLWSEKNLFSIDRYLEKKTLSKSDLILSPSHYLISELKKKYKIDSYYLPPLIEKLNSKKINTKEKFILTFGSISPGKGSEIIINIIDELLRVNQNIHYYWIGNVDKKFYKSNKDFEIILKRKTCFHRRIKVLPNLRRHKLFQYVNKAELIILPSLRDNSPNACLESLSLKKIVLARKNSGYDDLIRNNFNGFFFDKNKSKQIPALVKKILNFDQKKRGQLKKNIIYRNKLFSNKKFLSSYKKYIKKNFE